MALKIPFVSYESNQQNILSIYDVIGVSVMILGKQLQYTLSALIREVESNDNWLQERS